MMRETSMNLWKGTRVSFSPPPQSRPGARPNPVQTGSESENFNAVKLLDEEIFQGIGGTLYEMIVPDRVTLAVPDIVPKIVPIIYPSAKVAMPYNKHKWSYIYFSDNCSNYGGQCLFILYVRRLYDKKYEGGQSQFPAKVWCAKTRQARTYGIPPLLLLRCQLNQFRLEMRREIPMTSQSDLG